MSENSEHNAGESNASHAPSSVAGGAGINHGRRALARAVLVGTPVILTLASRPSLAAINNQCTVSGQLSGNMSAAGGGGPCENPDYKGLTPGYWGQHPLDWKNCFYGGLELKPGSCANGVMVGIHCDQNAYNNDGTKFHPTFFGAMFGTQTMMQVVQAQGNSDTYQLGAHTVAALLNACYFGKSGYGYSPAEVIALFQSYAYSANAVELKLAFEYLNSKGGA